MYEDLKDKFKEAARSILPISILVILINYIFLIPNKYSFEADNSPFGPVMLSMIISTIPLLVGTAFFSIGAEKSIAKIGEIVGSVLTKRKSIKLLLVIAGLMGFLATLAEPDLSVLSSRISPSGPDYALIVIAAIGVGLFMVFGILRVAYNKRLKYWFCIGYGLIFTLALFANSSFFAIIFDTGGMTTGVVTVPFILSLGMGVARVTSKDDADEDSFGFSGLCSMGAVLLVMIYSICLFKFGKIYNIELNLLEKFDSNHGTDIIMNELDSYLDMGILFGTNFLHSLRNVAISMLPIVVFFIIFNFFVKIKGRQLYSIILGFAFTFVGLVLFFLGVETGFMPTATSIGRYYGNYGKDQLPLFILIGIITGFISMLAEPAVSVLAKNVSEVSSGAISKNTIVFALCGATSLAIFLNILRIRFNVPLINFIIPLIILAGALSLFSSEIYVGIAIDAAGVATGTMASCFFLPMSIGYVATYYSTDPVNYSERIMSNGFGVVAIISIMPIIAMELIGIIANIKSRHNQTKVFKNNLEEDDIQIIHLPNPLIIGDDNG